MAIAIGAVNAWTRAPAIATPLVVTTELLMARLLFARRSSFRGTRYGVNDWVATASNRVHTPVSRTIT